MNLIYFGDSYKQLHDVMYPDGTEYVYSYLEARKGSEYEKIVFFGVQSLIKEYLEGIVLTKEMIDEAEILFTEHFKLCGKVWKREKWDYILEKHGGKLPVRIKAVPEGTVVPINNVLMTIVNTDPKCFWLPNFLETILQHVWYPCTVATRSKYIVDSIKRAYEKSVDDEFQFLADFYLHDFGQRGVAVMEQAGVGGMAHLVSSQGTDTPMGMAYAIMHYNASVVGVGSSVPATEHSHGTSLGKERQYDVTRRIMKLFPDGPLSIVSDSYDIEAAVYEYCHGSLKNDILARRNGTFVIRPDSPRFKGDNAACQIVWIATELAKAFGTTTNSKGFKVLDPRVGIIYGDGLEQEDIICALEALMHSGFAASTCVFGQGGGLLQKVNRDTCRFAFKSSAQRRKGVWYDIHKEPKDTSKTSKKGRLALYKIDGKFETLQHNALSTDLNLLKDIFVDGELKNETTFAEVRERANKG